MLHKNARRMIATGLVAASIAIAAPAAQAGCHIEQGCGGDPRPWTPGPVAAPPSAPGIGQATSGTPGGAITATAVWGTASGYPAVTGYRVQANRMEAHFNAATQQVWWVTVASSWSAVQPAATRTLSMPLPQTGTYTFQVQALNSEGTSPYSALSNRVQGQ